GGRGVGGAGPGAEATAAAPPVRVPLTRLVAPAAGMTMRTGAVLPGIGGRGDCRKLYRILSVYLCTMRWSVVRELSGQPEYRRERRCPVLLPAARRPVRGPGQRERRVPGVPRHQGTAGPELRDAPRPHPGGGGAP